MKLQRRRLSRLLGLERLESRDVPSFVPTGILALPGRPGSVAQGDFNGDGRVDLVTANTTVNSVSVRLGNGSGVFSGAINYTVPAGPVAIVAADFNRDGRMDFAVASVGNTISGSRSVSVFLGNGNGTFTPFSRVSLSDTPVAMATADFTGDGVVDLALAQAGGTVALLSGVGNGSFGSPVTIATGGIQPSALAVADLDRDGRPDLAVSHAVSNTVRVLINAKTGFQLSPAFNVGVNPTGVAVGDFNRDGNLDLVAINGGSRANSIGSVTVLLGDGLGGFVDPPVTINNVGAGPSSVAVADFDSNGTLDLAITNAGASNVLILSGNGAGNFTIQRPIPVTGTSRAVVISDVNRDGRPDLLVLSGNGNTVQVLANAYPGPAAGNLLPFGTPSDPITGTPRAIALADFNNDGFVDAAVSNTGNNTVTILYGNGTGTFGNLPSQTTPNTFSVGQFPRRIVAADLNGDGLVDVATVNRDSGTLSIRLDNGTGNYSIDTFDIPVGTRPIEMVLGDFNGDGRQDIAVLNEGSFPSPGTVSILLGDGSGAFTVSSTISVGVEPVAIAAGDLNGDGRTDLVVSNTGIGRLGGSLSILLSQSDGRFLQSAIAETRFNTVTGQVGLADFNRDGRLDVVVVSDFGSSFFRGDGRGNLIFDFNFGAYTSGSLRVVDFNQDGILDLVGSSGNQVALFQGTGTGGFTELPGFSADDFIRDLALQDINRQGLPDIVLLSDGALRTLANTGIPTALALVSSAATATYGQTVTLTATLTLPAGVVLPSGQQVVFEAIGASAILIGSATLQATAAPNTYVATLVASLTGNLIPGDYNLQARFLGTRVLSSSSSALVPLTINRGQIIVTVQDTQRRFNQRNPVFRTVITGLPAGVVPPVLRNVVFTTTATQASLPGLYPVNVTGTFDWTNYTGSANPTYYDPIFQAGTLEIVATPVVAIGRAGVVRFTAAGRAFALQPFGRGYTGEVRVATGDVNGDGISDIIVTPGPVTAPPFISGVNQPVPQKPEVVIYNGRNGALLTRFDVYDNDFLGGVYVAAADVLGLGRAQVIVGPGAGDGVGAGPDPEVYIYEIVGNAANQLQTITPFADYSGGVTVAATRGTLVVGTATGNAPLVKVYEGVGLGTVRTFNPFGENTSGGVSLAVTRGILAVGRGSGTGEVLLFNLNTLTLSSVLVTQVPVPAGAVGGTRLAFTVTATGATELMVGNGPGFRNALQYWSITTQPFTGLVTGTRRTTQFLFGTTRDGFWIG